MDIVKELDRLEQAGVIDGETARRIHAFYQNQAGESSSRLFVIFGVFGAILSALGIILVLAHNWEEISKTLKTIISLTPLLLGQSFCLYSWEKKAHSRAWIEASASFLILSCGAGIALISQVYHLPGELDVFVLTWLLCAAPVVWLSGSSIASLLVIIGATWYGIAADSFDRSIVFPWGYLVAMAIPVAHYLRIFRRGLDPNFQGFHQWFFPTSLLLVTGVLSNSHEELMLIVFAALAGILIQTGRLSQFNHISLRANGFLVLGSLSTVLLLLNASFAFPWEALNKMKGENWSWIGSTEFICLVILSITAICIQIRNRIQQNKRFTEPVDFVYIVLPALLLMPGQSSALPRIFVNLLIFLVGLGYVLKGHREERVGIMNYGLIILTALIICRYFDTEISFIVKGLLFIGVGAGFFFANYRFLSKHKQIKQ